MAGLGQTIGMGLADYGSALPQIQQIQEQQKQKQQQAALAQVLRQYSAQQGQPPALPGAAPAMPGGQPSGAPNPQMGAGAPNPQMGGGQPGGGFAGGMPNLDQMIAALGKSGLSDDQQFEALQKYGAFSTPYEKMLQQMELRQQQFQAMQQRVDDQLQNARFIASLKGNQSSNNTETRTAAENERTALQDLDKNISDARSFAQSFVNAGKIDSPDYKEAKQAYIDAVKAKQDYAANKKDTGAKTTPAKAAPVAPTRDQRIVILKDGKPVGTIPQSQVEEAKKQGYTVQQ